ncbi:hypothetical protein [uncultured Kordia sp.]|uniref:hypothetical protein n=1 Tax=uncultured Kordia sp. TaxID=507699 RepID=UPI002612D4B9|nr:hypothetical protein [uncultured Kordia sp.]
MKKRSIKKLKLKKASISTLNIKAAKGGFGDSVYICESRDLCITIDVTRCYGNWNCGLFDPSGNL